MNSPRQRHALFTLLTGALMISFSGVWVKLSQVPPVVSAFYQVFFGVLITLVAIYLGAYKPDRSQIKPMEKSP